MTHVPDADKIRLELEKGSGICRIGQVAEETLSGAVEDWFLSLARRIGTPVSQSTDGDLVLRIRDKAFGEHDSRTRGPNTNRKLGFHTDRCDVIGFLCLQPAKIGGENQVVSSLEIEKIIRLERPDLHEILCQPFAYKRHVIDQGNNRPFCEQPIFSWKEDFFACSYLRVLIDRANDDEQCPSLSALQRESLDFLDCVCERKKLQTRFTLKRGEIVFLNNWTTLHRRTAFEDEKEEEKRRHLLRVWISVPNSRPLDESFLANFGSTEAGAVRGGILPIASSE